ncbi:MAG: tripartite tricarboxylate transporter substrate binding protein [Betaproteobacteria bacterium]|nr:tripartite tricarboxylate transporter substrate binding protein [Betaproteobacteria bacterium]
MSASRAIAASALALLSAAALAQTYPTKPIRIVVPFAAGGPADVYARVLGRNMQETLGQPSVVENRPGGGSVVGTDIVAKSPADGYTLLLMSNTHTVNESLLPKRPFQLMRDFVPIAPINYSDLVLVVHPSVGIDSVKRLLAMARSRPGVLNYASSGPGTPYHMAGELFKSMAKVDIVHVPYKGSSGARTDVLGGQVEMMFDAITTMAPNVQAGRVRALATTGRTRSAALPSVPTVDEAGVPGYDAVIWLGIMAPTGTPKPVVDRLNAEVRKVLARADIKDAWKKQGAETMDMGPERFDEFLRGDIEKWASVVKGAGIKVD